MKVKIVGRGGRVMNVTNPQKIKKYKILEEGNSLYHINQVYTDKNTNK